MTPAIDGEAPDGGVLSAGLSMDHLMGLLSERATVLIASQERLRALLDANRLIVSELSLSAVLRRIVDVAREVSGARYAALGLLDGDGQVDRFVQLGLDEAVAPLGEAAWSAAVIGYLADRPGTVRTVPVSSDRRFADFPDGEPRFDSFLAVPVQVSGTLFGHLCLADRQGSDFTDEDEELVVALAATAGIAIENARLYEESGRRQEWLRARAEVARHLSADDQQRSLQRIAETVARLAHASVVSVVRPDERPDLVRVVAATGEGADDLVGVCYRRSGSLADAAMSEGVGLIVTEPDAYLQSSVGEPYHGRLGSVMTLPLVAERDTVGAVIVGRASGRSAFTDADLDMAESFTAQAAVAMELADARADQQRLALLQDRDRIARDLHDHVVQRLFAIGLSLQSVAAVSDERTGARLTGLVEDLDATIREIRTTIFELREDNGGEDDLRRVVLAARDATTPLLPRAVEVSFAGPLDTLVDSYLISDVEAVVREGLGNVVRHSGAERAAVRIQAHGDELEVRITDDGCGITDTDRRSGLSNLQHRAEKYGGSMEIGIPATGGTRLCWTIPINI